MDLGGNLMENIQIKFKKIRLRDVPQNGTLINKISIYFGVLSSMICTLDSVITVQNILRFYYSVFRFVDIHLVKLFF
jgi:hypothetical protein